MPWEQEVQIILKKKKSYSEQHHKRLCNAPTLSHTAKIWTGKTPLLKKLHWLMSINQNPRLKLDDTWVQLPSTRMQCKPNEEIIVIKLHRL